MSINDRRLMRVIETVEVLAGQRGARDNHAVLWSDIDTSGTGSFFNGTLSKPGVRSINDPNTGIRWFGDDRLSLVAGGVDQLIIGKGMPISGALVVEDLTDTTEGKLIVPGWMGLGATGACPVFEDADDHTLAAGFYSVTGDTSNRPFDLGSLLVIRTGTDSMTQLAQEVVPGGDHGPLMYRHYLDGDRSDWASVAANGQDAAFAALSADTLGLNGAAGSLTAHFIQGDDTPSERVVIAQSTVGQSIGAYVDGTGIAHILLGTSDVMTMDGTYTAFHYGSGTEGMRLDANGNLLVGASSGTARVQADQTSDAPALLGKASDALYTSDVLLLDATRAASSSFNFIEAFSGDLGNLEFKLTGDGDATATGSFTGGGADYAEWFEWHDGNQGHEDRRGVSVVLEGDRIRPAQPGDDPIGVISANPSVVGDGDIDCWKGKYLRDDFGAYIREEYHATGEDGQTITQQRRKLNPSYDPSMPYVPRAARAEWDMVGLLGKLRLRKGQPVGARWIKMRDVSASVEEWLVR